MRTNVYTYEDDGYGGKDISLAGWFESAKAQRWSDADHNGNGSGGTGRGHAIWRTSGGRWVLEYWTNWQGESGRYSYVSDGEARDWLLSNDKNDATETYFADIPEEEDRRGPGRPEIGGNVHVRLGDLLAQVDKFAAGQGMTRAEATRELIAAGLRRFSLAG